MSTSNVCLQKRNSISPRRHALDLSWAQSDYFECVRKPHYQAVRLRRVRNFWSFIGKMVKPLTITEMITQGSNMSVTIPNVMQQRWLLVLFTFVPVIFPIQFFISVSHTAYWRVQFNILSWYKYKVNGTVMRAHVLSNRILFHNC